MDLMAGKTLMDQGFSAEDLEKLTGDIFKPLTKQQANEVARRKRGFVNRKAERDARKTLVAQIRRYHRVLNGPRSAEMKRRALKRRKATNKLVRELEAQKNDNAD